MFGKPGFCLSSIFFRTPTYVNDSVAEIEGIDESLNWRYWHIILHGREITIPVSWLAITSLNVMDSVGTISKSSVNIENEAFHLRLLFVVTFEFFRLPAKQLPRGLTGVNAAEEAQAFLHFGVKGMM